MWESSTILNFESVSYELIHLLKDTQYQPVKTRTNVYESSFWAVSMRMSKTYELVTKICQFANTVGCWGNVARKSSRTNNVRALESVLDDRTICREEVKCAIIFNTLKTAHLMFAF